MTVDPIVIGGCGRSGTTLIRVLLDSHPDIAIGPESDLFTSAPVKFENLARNFAVPISEIHRIFEVSSGRKDFISAFFGRVSKEAGKQRWGEKTPRNVHHIERILSMFPKARFIHVVRDGRDVVCSLRTHPRYRIENGSPVATGIVKPIEECVDRWLGDTDAALPWRKDPRYHEVRYEDLVATPELTLRRILEFVGEIWDPRILRFHEQPRDALTFPQNPEATRPMVASRVGRWRNDLTEDELSYVEDRLRERLMVFGYPVGNPRGGAEGK